MTEDEEFKRILDRINKKMENPKNKKKVNDAIDIIEDIFETPIQVSIDFRVGIEKYKEIWENYEESDLPDSYSNSVMTLKDLKYVLDREDNLSYKLCIDPIYLNDGINKINNILVTTYGDGIILVPTIENDKENE